MYPLWFIQKQMLGGVPQEKRRKGTPRRVVNDSLGGWGVFVSHYLTAARQTGDEENESGPSAQNPAALAPLPACLTSR